MTDKHPLTTDARLVPSATRAGYSFDNFDRYRLSVQRLFSSGYDLRRLASPGDPTRFGVVMGAAKDPTAGGVTTGGLLPR
jgi:hypothetical protein